MKALLFFKIGVPYYTNYNKSLDPFAESSTYDPITQERIYLIPINYGEQVNKIIGKKMSFVEEQLKVLYNLIPKDKKKIFIEEEYDNALMKVHLETDIYIVIHEKDKQVRGRIPVERVNLLWEILKTYPIEKLIKTTTIEKHWCEKLGFDNFIKKNGKFNSKLFSGSRAQYLAFYHTVKILQALGFAEYRREGEIARLRDGELKHEQTTLFFGKKESKEQEIRLEEN